MDTYIIIFGALLAATLIAFASGIIPYPYGWLVLTMLLVARWLQVRTDSDRGHRR